MVQAAYKPFVGATRRPSDRVTLINYLQELSEQSLVER